MSAASVSLGDDAERPTPRAKRFPLSAVRITGGPFLKAQELDRAYLLKLDPDALMAGPRRAAGLEPKARHYGGWESGGGGGMVGHYLSACAMMSAATGDAELRRRVDYLVDEFEAVQKADGDGSILAYPQHRGYFERIAKNQVPPQAVTPWYVEHKSLAGLRDAYVHCGNEKAKQVLIRAADWTIETMRNLSDENWQKMLDGEHGGPQEIFADLYGWTGERKYLDLALKFRHLKVFNPLRQNLTDALDGLHANTQIPKFIGDERIYELTGDTAARDVADCFWNDIANRRSWIMGGNSQWECFYPYGEDAKQLEEICGPETCNTYNMLKLTAMKFERKPDAWQINYYERALYNHILGSIHFDHGGFAYYTPMRPGHYRTFSTEFDSFWCCVGTGMENHAKYGEMIYVAGLDESGTSDASLYVNLFIPSTLDWREQGVKLRMETEFPYRETVRLHVDAAPDREIELRIRRPGWWLVNDSLSLRLNGIPIDEPEAERHYIKLRRTWKAGDVLSFETPMHLSATSIKGDGRRYEAFKYGPIVLVGEMGKALPNGELLTDADFRPTAARGGNLASRRLTQTDVPILVAPSETESWELPKVQPVPGKPLTFTTGTLTRPRPVTLRPIWEIGDQRYIIYFRRTDEAEYRVLAAKLKVEEQAALELDRRTVDSVRIGAQQSEADHQLDARESNTGRAPAPYDNWRDARGHFSYVLKVSDETLALRCVYWGSDGGRAFDILVDDVKLAT